MKAAQPDFKMTVFYVNDNREAVALQKAMFVLGFKWVDSGRGEQREAREYFTRGGYIYVDQDCRLSWSGPRPSHHTVGKYTAALQEAVFVAAKAHKEWKKKERKQSRKRKAARREGFTINNGIPPNVTGKIEVLFNGGTIDGSAEVQDWEWSTGPGDWRILGWRLPKPATVTLEEMIGDIAGTLNKGVIKVDNEGWIDWYVSSSYNYDHGTPGWSGWLPQGTVIDVKYRNGKVRENLKAGVDSGANGAYWANDGLDMDIVAYRVKTLKVESLSAISVPVGKITSGTITASGNIAQEGNPAWCVGCTPEDCSGCGEAPVEVQPDTNPKKQYGLASIPLEMWPDLASAYGALGLYNGALKYGKANFANTPVEASIYIAAARRHLASWVAGEEFDQADGVPHLGGVLANIAIILSARAAGTLIDDRMLLDGWLKERDLLKAIVPKLQEVHAGKTPKHYTREG